MSTSNEEKNAGIKIPGFEISYPKSCAAAVSFIALCAAIVAIVAIVLIWARPGSIQEVFNSYRQIRVDISDAEHPSYQVLSPRKQYQFMTPSTESWTHRKEITGYDTLNLAQQLQIEKKYDWEKNVDSLKIENF